MSDTPPADPNRPAPTRLDRVRKALDTARSEVAASASLTAEHARRAKDHTTKMLHRKRLRDRLPAEKAALGEAVAAAGLGDDGLRQQLAQLDERIRNVRAANGSHKPLEVERRGVLLRLAEPFAEQSDVPPQVREPHAAVRATQAELADLDRDLAENRPGLIPPTTGGKLRLAAGVAVPVVLLLVVGNWVFGGKGKTDPPPPEPAPVAAGPAVIEAVTDEAALTAAVGLVVCGTRETDAGGKVREIPFGTGSSFAVTRDGVLVTNKHVVEEVANLRNATHTLDKVRREKGIDVVPTVWVFFGRDQKHVARVLHVSDKYDLAVLKVDRTFDKVFALRADAAIPRGRKVFALGYPAAANDAMSADEALKQDALRKQAKPRVEQSFLDKQFEFVLTSGHVGRMAPIDDQTWLQHDTVIHPGNSGGALVGEDAVVVGVNTLKHKSAVGVSMSLGLPQLKAELEPHAAGLVWK